MAATHVSVPSGANPVTPGTPSSAAMARAERGYLAGLHRQAVIGPAASDRGVASTTYSRLSRSGSASRRRREANARAYFTPKAFSAARKSASSDSTTSALAKS